MPALPRESLTRLARKDGLWPLLGDSERGKTSILHLTRRELDQLAASVIVASFDVWAVPKPEDVPRLALNRMVVALDDYIDTIDLRDLPSTYQRLVVAEPTGRLARILGPAAAVDSVEALRRLTPILDVLDARLVLIVEDVERAGIEFDTRHLARFLWALRQIEGASFILAVEPEQSGLDFTKLCDTIELVPLLELEYVEEVLTVSYAHWRTAFAYIDPHRARLVGGKLQLAERAKEGMTRYISRAGKDTPLDAILALLQNPRALKHVLRRIDHAWRELHGEADLDDLIVVTALRYGARPAYDFLVADIDAAREKPRDMAPRTQTVKEDWEKKIEGMENGAAVQRLVDLLEIRQLSKGLVMGGTSSPQGVHKSEPTDYFRRIVAERLDATELRDQVVLRDIECWQKTRDPGLVAKLVDSSEEHRQYADVWRSFSFRHADAELMQLTDGVVSRVLERDGSAAAGDHTAIIALWLACNRRSQRDQFTDWIQGLILSAVPISLHLANGLYYYWTGKNGVVSGSRRATIRRVTVDAVRDSIRTGEDLTRVLATNHPYTIMQLITETDVDTTATAYEAWQHYLPPILIDGAKQDPELIIPELANLAGDEESGYRALGPLYPPVFTRRYRVDRERMTVLFGARLDEALELLVQYDGDNPYAVRAKDDAKSWLKERQSQRASKKPPH